MLEGMDLKNYEGKMVKLTSIYNGKYYATLTEYDQENGYITIKNEGFQEITFAIEEVKNITMKTETIIFAQHLENKIKQGFTVLMKWLEPNGKNEPYPCYLVGIDE